MSNTRILYHGTTMENAITMLGSNFSSIVDETVWNCSDDDMLYMAEKDYDGEENEGLRIAAEAAQIAAAYLGSESSDLVVLKLEIPEFMFEEAYVTEDDSCDNMYGCWQIKQNDLKKSCSLGCQAARNDINDRVINQAFKESIAREKNKTFDDGQDITVEDSDRKMESLISEIYLTVKNPDKEEQEEKKDADSYINEIVKYIPVYKPENYLYIPEFKNFNASMQANGYGYKKEEKKIKKSKGRFEDWSSWRSKEYKSTKAECLQFINTMEDVNKYDMTEKEYNTLEKKKLKSQKKYYNKYVKKLMKEYGEDAGYEVQQKKGQNFTVTIGLNKKENRMWAAYLFEDYIFAANGDIRPVIQFMNLIPYGTLEFDYKALDAEKQGIEED